MVNTKKELFKIEQQTALWLPWDMVGRLIADELNRLISKPVRVRADYSDVEYWCCEFTDYRMDVTTQERLLDAIGATGSERQETMYYSDDACANYSQPITSLGMEASQKLLLMALELNEAKGMPITHKGLWSYVTQ